MSKRAIGSLLCAMAIAAFAAFATPAVGADVPGGIKGDIVKVDTAKSTLTVHTQTGDKTYTIAQTTQIVGPRGGIVHKRLQDPRFHAGLHVTIVASGMAATQVLLGVDRKAKTGDAATSKTTTGFRGDAAGKGEAAKTEEAPADEDNEFPGKIKSVDADKNILVVTLLTGKDHSFMVGSEAKLTIGARRQPEGSQRSRPEAGRDRHRCHRRRQESVGSESECRPCDVPGWHAVQPPLRWWRQKLTSSRFALERILERAFWP